MRTKSLLAAIAVVLSGVGAGVARAEQPPLEAAGQPFYFSVSCTGLGDVIVVNQALALTAALQVVGSNTVVLIGPPGIEKRANGECTFTGGGFSLDSIEPFDEPTTEPVVIVGK